MLTLFCLLVLQDPLNDKDTVLMDSPKGRSNLQVSPDGRRAACLVSKGEGKDFLVHKDGQSSDFDNSGIPRFGPKGRRLGYTASKGNQQYVVMDGKSTGPVDSVYYNPGIVFSSDEAHWAFMTVNSDTKKEAVYLDGEKIGECEQKARPHPNLLFTPDGKLAYRGVQSENGLQRHHVIIDRKPVTPGYDSIGSIYMSADGKRLAYEARRGDHEFMVLDGTEGTPYSLTYGFTFSPDSRRFAFMGSPTDEGPGCAVIDGREGEKGHFADYFTFSPDSKRLAYVLQAVDRWKYVVLDGKKGPRFENAYDLTFSFDSKRFAYSVQDGSDRRAVIDGKKGQAFKWTEQILFTPDSRYAVYLAQDDKNTHLVVDHKIIRTFEHAAGLRVFPDGKRVGLGAAEGDKIWWRVVPIE